ncbi:hypothetical protein LZL87_013905 [Fusarium oxysporum]|nr:hypothetical protein LZL87_013905 [Fusarium oxysporum]
MTIPACPFLNPRLHLDRLPQRATLHKGLWGIYNAIKYLESFPFLVFGCHDGPPDDPPFLVARAIAIWRDAKDFAFMTLVGDFAQGDEIEVDDDILDQIVLMEIPSKHVILYLANVWPECQAISLLWTMLVVELPLVSEEEHLERLQNLPTAIDACFLILRLNNGPLPNAERIRAPEVKPDPKELFRTADHKFGDLFLVDYAVGVMQMACNFGRRFSFGWKGDTPHNVEPRTSQGEGSVNGLKCFAFDQAAFVANEREIALSCASVPL